MGPRADVDLSMGARQPIEDIEASLLAATKVPGGIRNVTSKYPPPMSVCAPQNKAAHLLSRMGGLIAVRRVGALRLRL